MVVLVPLVQLQIQLELPVPEVMVVSVVLDYQRALQEVRSFMLVVEAALEAAHGYDTKHAQHLVRLLRMAVEALETGELVVLRPDRDELLGIRDGAWTYEELIENAEALHADVRRAAASSTLPDRADESAIDALCVAVVADVLENR